LFGVHLIETGHSGTYLYSTLTHLISSRKCIYWI